MSFLHSRTTLALVLTIAALVVPCGAWYVLGMREVQRNAAQIEAGPHRLAKDTAAQLAGRLQERLDALLEAESNRPFYHYQSLYHDPKGVSEGASIVPSPLAQGPTDPFIRAYFQIDPTGRVTLPTLPEGDLNAADRLRAAGEHGIQKELQSVAGASACVASLQQAQQSPTKSVPAPPLTLAVSSQQSVPQPSASSFAQSTVSQPRYEVMESDAYEQNAQAAQIYSDLKYGGNLPQRAVPQKDEKPKKVTIAIGGFRWCSMQTSNGQSLVALRDVTTPEGILVQGFVISNEAVAESLKNAALPARFSPNVSSGAYVAAAHLGNAGWYIVVSAAKEFDAALLRVHHSETNFLESFFAGVGAASVAGLCVVVLVWHTERLARQRSQFAASAAHELRTPLAGLRMYSEMLAEGLGDPLRAKDYAHRAAEEAARLGRVVSNVLGFTRLERGALQVRPQSGDLAAFVRDCVERQRPALEAGGVGIEFSVANDLPGVRFDRDALAEILQNLIDNAEKYSRSAEDRSIKVTLDRRHEGCKDKRFAGPGAIVSVCDHGPGIPADMLRRLFRPFARGGRDDAPAGLGLGLALVKALAEAHGGAVSYETGPDGGSVFAVFLPQ
ncbi:MAG TPA: HAMP domain-containing sensor histidine kinase [Verrucomicrobiae bacterium]|nr:HAMP domain-containing sensor histidine kinase [Verrucomicrobiae bacterium]